MFHRMLSGRALLYTEMVVADAMIHGDREYLLGYNVDEHPVALQVGGSDPAKLVQAAQIAQEYGYDEINLNVGCPSDRVQSGRFGACLMAEPELVATCFEAMQAAVDIPVTVKCRIGIDEQVPEESLPQFLDTVSAAGCAHFIVHARKAWLEGLSPKDNRTVPPLDYGLVRAMKVQFPDLEIVLNGGLESLDQIETEAASLDGAMFGRAAYHTPWILHEVDARVFGEAQKKFTRDDIVEQLIQYAESKQEYDRSTKALIRHIMGLFHGEAGARIWRRALSESDRDLSVSKRITQAHKIFLEARERVHDG